MHILETFVTDEEEEIRKLNIPSATVVWSGPYSFKEAASKSGGGLYVIVKKNRTPLYVGQTQKYKSRFRIRTEILRQVACDLSLRQVYLGSIQLPKGGVNNSKLRLDLESAIIRSYLKRGQKLTNRSSVLAFIMGPKDALINNRGTLPPQMKRQIVLKRNERFELEFDNAADEFELSPLQSETDEELKKKKLPLWILHGFEAHRTELKAIHRDQLADVVDTIIKSFDGNRPIRCMLLIGHAATWKGISKPEYRRRALVRAQGAAVRLSAQLETSGLVSKIFNEEDFFDPEEPRRCKAVSGIDVALFIGGRGDDQPFAPNLIHRTDRIARDNRALNRRVEIFPFNVPKRKKKCVHEDIELAKKLREMPIAGLDQSPNVRARIGCLRDMLVDALLCRKSIDDVYLHSDDPLPPSLKTTPFRIIRKHLINELKKKCGKKKGTNLANCIKSLYDDMLHVINVESRELNIQAALLKQLPSQLSKTSECRNGFFFMTKAGSGRSIYRCFKTLIPSLFGRFCKEKFRP